MTHRHLRISTHAARYWQGSERADDAECPVSQCIRHTPSSVGSSDEQSAEEINEKKNMYGVLRLEVGDARSIAGCEGGARAMPSVGSNVRALRWVGKATRPKEPYRSKATPAAERDDKG